LETEALEPAERQDRLVPRGDRSRLAPLDALRHLTGAAFGHVKRGMKALADACGPGVGEPGKPGLAPGRGQTWHPTKM